LTFVNYGNSAKPRLSLTPAQRDIAVSKFTAQFSVQHVVKLPVACRRQFFKREMGREVHRISFAISAILSVLS
jgi:hypothetical protein